jgi:ABC-type uncharacterized transport system substrate-binding protein
MKTRRTAQNPATKLRALCAAMAVFCGFCIAFTTPALAHPHVWVIVKSSVMTTPEGRITGIRHSWTFDEPFSSYATLGMDTNKDGKLSREELTPLAKVNVESLQEYGFFTILKQGKNAITFSEPVDYFLDHDGKALTLHFTLPVKSGELAVKDARLEVADPSFFVSFEYAKDEPVKVEGFKGTCKANLKPPAPSVFNRLSQLGENFFEQPGSAIGNEFVTPVSFSCP